MRKLLALLLVFCLVAFSTNFATGQNNPTEPQTEPATQPAAEQPATTPPPTTDDEDETATTAKEDEVGMLQVFKEQFIEGGWEYMLPILICMIIGLAMAIERVITLNIASVNTEKLLTRVDENLKRGDVKGAMEVCRSTAGPAASVLYEGLRNAGNGPDAVEKAIVSYGSVQMGMLEKGLIWISLFIAMAPMLGFLGTVVGMIQAFDEIERVGDISPTIVAGGIKVALLTTVFGLIVAIILQVLYNYLISKIDGITNKMEEASVALVDMMVTNNSFNK